MWNQSHRLIPICPKSSHLYQLIMAMRKGASSPCLLFLFFFFTLVLLGCPSQGHPNYKDALAKSILFFQGQRSGRLPTGQQMSWRSNSGLSDGSLARVRFFVLPPPSSHFISTTTISFIISLIFYFILFFMNKLLNIFPIKCCNCPFSLISNQTIVDFVLNYGRFVCIF